MACTTPLRRKPPNGKGAMTCPTKRVTTTTLRHHINNHVRLLYCHLYPDLPLPRSESSSLLVRGYPYCTNRWLDKHFLLPYIQHHPHICTIEDHLSSINTRNTSPICTNYTVLEARGSDSAPIYKNSRSPGRIAWVLRVILDLKCMLINWREPSTGLGQNDISQPKSFTWSLSSTIQPWQKLLRLQSFRSVIKFQASTIGMHNIVSYGHLILCFHIHGPN